MGKMKKLKARLKTKKRLKIRRRHPQCLSPTPNYTEDIHENLKIFDKLFSEFEFSYVSCMVHVKTVKGKKSLKLCLLTFKLHRVRDPAGCDLLVLRHPAEGDQQPDDHTGHDRLLRPKVRAKKATAKLLQTSSAAWCSPSHDWRLFAAWWSSPRVPSTWNETPRTFQSSSGEILRLPSTTFVSNSNNLDCRPFKNLLRKIRDLLLTLTPGELFVLERLLCQLEEPTDLEKKLQVAFSVLLVPS